MGKESIPDITMVDTRATSEGRATPGVLHVSHYVDLACPAVHLEVRNVYLKTSYMQTWP